MKFVVTKKGLSDNGKIYEAKVVGRYANGYRVEIGGEQFPMLFEDVEIIEISEEEENVKGV